MVPAESRQVFYHDAVHFTHPDIRHQPFKIIPLEVRAGLPQIAVAVEYLHILMRPDIFSAKLQLIVYGFILPFCAVHRQSGVNADRINLILLYRHRCLSLL